MLKNLEVQALISAIGAGVGEEFDLEKRRYDKVCILADADVDGLHIRTLLLTFFFRQMRPLVEHGHIYICQPPLYSTEVSKAKIYLKDDHAKDAFLARQPEPQEGLRAPEGPRRDGRRGAAHHHDGGRRSARCCRSQVEQAALADEVVSTLMGDVVELRKQFIVTNAKDVRFLDI